VLFQHVTGTFATQFEHCKWNCTSSGGAVCAHASGYGNIDEDVNVLPASGAVTFSALCNLPSSAVGIAKNKFGFNGGSNNIVEINTSNDLFLIYIMVNKFDLQC
jgi:hypothetical protein